MAAFAAIFVFRRNVAKNFTKRLEIYQKYHLQNEYFMVQYPCMILS